MWRWIVGTVRPVAFFAGIPVVIGALVSGTQIRWNIIYAVGAAMLGLGFANSFNSIVDRYIDRLNPAKKTLAVKRPLAAWYGVLFLLPVLAFCLRSNNYNHCLFAILYYLCFLYSYWFGRVRLLKRVTVAAIVALTSCLYVQTFNLALWIFASLVFLYNFIRESNKDKKDRREDELMRFYWKGSPVDCWCLGAPFLAVGIYISCLVSNRHPIDLTEAVISFGISISVWSYVQIRYRYKQYKMRLLHQSTGGRLGAVIALVGLMPSFVTPAFILVVLWNTSSIVYRSFLNKKFAFQGIAVLHDAWLWASLPVLAMAKTGYEPVLLVTSVVIGCMVYIHENRRLRSIPRTSY